MTSKTWVPALLALIVSIPAPSAGQQTPVKGTYDWDCSACTFRVPAPPDDATKDEMSVRLEWRGGLSSAWESEGWVDVKAKRCSSNGECEDATKAQIKFEKIGGKRLAGYFALEFKNGHEEEHFSVRYRHTGPRIICE